VATATVGLPVASPWSVDTTIRACGSLSAWATAATRYPDALAGRDGLSLLLERCTDPASGLAVAPACAALVEAPVTPSPSPTSTPAPTPSPTLSPSPSPTPSAEARLVRLPRFDTRVKGADRVRTFAIRGSSPEELLQAMQVEGAAFCPQHASACTQTQPRIRPRVVTNPVTGSCRVTGLQVSTDDTVHIPRWAGPKRVFPELVAWWRQVNAHVRWHEAQHIRITKRHLASLRKRIVGKSCQRINLEVQRVSQKVMQDQQAFDQRDQGWLPPYDGPRP
jgi:predicted secreted Zn-dependent protease